jgi:hypothetical protein
VEKEEVVVCTDVCKVEAKVGGSKDSREVVGFGKEKEGNYTGCMLGRVMEWCMAGIGGGERMDW